MCASPAKVSREGWHRATSLEQKGHALMKQVTKLSAEDKFHQATLIFERAGQEYCILSQWTRAAECYVICGDCNKRLRQEQLAASYYIQAGEHFAKFDPFQAVHVYRKAVLHLKNLGHFAICATIEMDIAKLHHDALGHEGAARAYENAALFYRTDAYIPQAVKAITYGGMEYVRVGKYAVAHKFYTKAYKWSHDHNLLKFQANGFAQSAVSCLLAARKLNKTRRLLAKFEKDHLFITSREYRFLLDILHCCETGGYDAFIDHVWNFDYVRKFWPYELVLYQAIFDNIKNIKHETEPSIEELKQKKIDQLKRGESDADTVSSWSGSDETLEIEKEKDNQKK